MKSKFLKILAATVIGSTLFVGCGSNNEEVTPPVTDSNSVEKPDAITSSSKASDESQLQKALSENGTWIVLVQNDITTNKDLEIKGEFSKPSKDDATKMEPAGRNLTLYSKDDSGNISKTFKITTPKLIVKSKDTIIKDGIINGDIYVEADNLTLYKTKVEGNVYFMNDSAKNTFKLDEGATVTGEIKLK